MRGPSRRLAAPSRLRHGSRRTAAIVRRALLTLALVAGAVARVRGEIAHADGDLGALGLALITFGAIAGGVSAIVYLVATFAARRPRDPLPVGVALLGVVALQVLAFAADRLNDREAPIETAAGAMFALLPPLLVILDWFVFADRDPGRRELGWGAVLPALTVPIAWLIGVYSVGALTGLYPNERLDPAAGEGVVDVIRAILFVVGVPLVVAAVGIAAQRRRSHRPDEVLPDLPLSAGTSGTS